MNIDNLMDQLVREQLSAEEVSQAYKAALDREHAKKVIEPARANVLQALKKYCTILYGEVDDTIMKEFETTLKDLEKISQKSAVEAPKKFVPENDDERLARFLRGLV